mgnify:CR=1 FL=1
MTWTDQDNNYFAATLGFLGLICGLFFFQGCATAASAKREVAKELTKIIEYQDCPTICDQLRVYLETQLGK